MCMTADYLAQVRPDDADGVYHGVARSPCLLHPIW